MLTVRYDWLGLRAGDRLLDFGCGGGRHSFEAMRRGAVVTALDSDREALTGAPPSGCAAMLDEDKETAEAGGQGHVVAGDGPSLPFPDGCFDRVIAAEVLEHVPDDAAVLAELARVLRPGGLMAVTVPRWYPEVVNWALSARVPQRPRRPRPHLPAQPACDRPCVRAGLEPYRQPPCPRPPQPVLVAALRPRARPARPTPW